MIAITGRGIAALTCAQRLAEAGIEVCVDGPPRQGGPVVLIGDHTLGLLAEVFHQAAIQQVGHPVSRRQVHWHQTPPASVAVSARAVALDTLTAVLETQLAASVRFQDATPLDGMQPLHWRLDATGRRASVAHTIAGVDSTSFGTRHIIAAAVSLDPEGSDCTVIECLQDGWLFLCPTASERGILQLMWPGLPHEPERTMQDVSTDRPISHTASIAKACERLSVLPPHRVFSLPWAPIVGWPLGKRLSPLTRSVAMASVQPSTVRCSPAPRLQRQQTMRTYLCS